MEGRGHRAHLQRAGEGGRTGARPGCIVPVKAVDELDDDVVLELSLDSKLAGHVLIQGRDRSVPVGALRCKFWLCAWGGAHTWSEPSVWSHRVI